MCFSKIILSLLLASAFFVSCKKDKNDPAPVTVIKYEIRTTAPLKDTAANNGVFIQYVNGAGQLQSATNFTAGMTTWSITDTVRTNTRPLNLSLSQSADYFLTASGSIYGSISVNGGVRTFFQESTLDLGTVHRARIITLNATID